MSGQRAVSRTSRQRPATATCRATKPKNASRSDEWQKVPSSQHTQAGSWADQKASSRRRRRPQTATAKLRDEQRPSTATTRGASAGGVITDLAATVGVWNTLWLVPPRRESNGMPPDPAKVRRCKLEANAAVRSAETERKAFGKTPVTKENIAVNSQRPFEQFRNVQIAPRATETAAALADAAASASGVPRAAGQYVNPSSVSKHWIAKNFSKHGRKETDANLNKLLKAKKEMIELRTSISNFGGCVSRPHSAEPYRLENQKTAIETANVAQNWQPPTHKAWYPKKRYKKPYVPIKKNQFATQLASKEAKMERDLELTDVARETELEVEQIKLLYKAFDRSTNFDHFFTLNDFELLIRRLGIGRRAVAERIFKCFAKKRPGVSMYQAIVPFRVAVHALCVLGIGSREKQAEAIFKVCDVDKSRSLERSELLKFVTEFRPVPEVTEGNDKDRQKIRAAKDAFRKVGALFEAVGMTGREELEMSQFVARVVGSETSYRCFEAINPYRYYFPDWKGNDYSLQNVLDALFRSSEQKERRAILKDRVAALSLIIDDDGSGSLDLEEFAAVLVALGYTQKEADAEAAESCGKVGIPINKFVDQLTEIAGSNISDFERLEAAYKGKRR